jgi:hypothetical protein
MTCQGVTRDEQRWFGVIPRGEQKGSKVNPLSCFISHQGRELPDQAWHAPATPPRIGQPRDRPPLRSTRPQKHHNAARPHTRLQRAQHGWIQQQRRRIHIRQFCMNRRCTCHHPKNFQGSFLSYPNPRIEQHPLLDSSGQYKSKLIGVQRWKSNSTQRFWKCSQQWPNKISMFTKTYSCSSTRSETTARSSQT